MLATTVDFLKESGEVFLIMTGPPTDAIHGVNQLTRTSCSRCPCSSTTFQENLTVSAASTPGAWMNKMQDNCIFISAKERTNIDALKALLYERVKQIHITRFPYNDFLFQQYDEE